MHAELTHRTTRLLCVAMAVGLVTVGLWPFAFRPVNHVHWVQPGGGLQFGPEGIAYDPEPLPVTLREATPASVTVELWVEPDLEPHDDVHHILTIYNDHLPSNLVLCQWKRELLLRVPVESKQGFRETSISGALKGHSAKLITLTCSPDGTSWFLDGIPARTSPRFTIPGDSLNGRLILGDSPEGKHAWRGRLYGLALFNRTLQPDEVLRDFRAWTNHLAGQLVSEPGLITLLPFDEGKGQWAQDQSPHHHALFIPQGYRTLHKCVLVWPSALRQADLQDVWINLAGFVPFGFLLYWHRQSSVGARRLRSAGFTIIAGGAISLFIELTQVWLPNRYSSSMDLACNVLGTMLGVGAAILVRSHPLEGWRRFAK